MMIWWSEGYFDLKDLSHWDDVSFLICKRGVVKMASWGNHHKNEIFVLFWWSARLLRETVPLLRYAKYWAQVRNLDCMLAREQRRVTPLGSDLIWVGKIHQQISWPKKEGQKVKVEEMDVASRYNTGVCQPFFVDFIWSDSWCVCVLESRVTDPKGKSMHHDVCVGLLDSWMGEDFTFHWVERLISRCQWKFCNLRGILLVHILRVRRLKVMFGAKNELCKWTCCRELTLLPLLV